MDEDTALPGNGHFAVYNRAGGNRNVALIVRVQDTASGECDDGAADRRAAVCGQGNVAVAVHRGPACAHDDCNIAGERDGGTDGGGDEAAAGYVHTHYTLRGDCDGRSHSDVNTIICKIRIGLTRH